MNGVGSRAAGPDESAPGPAGALGSGNCPRARKGPRAMGHLVSCGRKGLQDEDALVGVQVGPPELPQQGIPSRHGALGPAS